MLNYHNLNMKQLVIKKFDKILIVRKFSQTEITFTGLVQDTPVYEVEVDDIGWVICKLETFLHYSDDGMFKLTFDKFHPRRLRVGFEMKRLDSEILLKFLKQN